MNPIEFSRNLFALRMEHKMSVEELAELLNVAPEAICEWECAKTSPTMDQMDRLAKIYRIPLDEIVRTVRPRPEIVVPPPQELPEEEPVAEEAPAEEIPVEEPEVPAEEPPALPRRGKKPRSKWWDVAVIALLLAIMAAATVFLIKPEWMPWLK